MKQKKQFKIIIATLIFLAVIAAMVIVYVSTRPRPSENSGKKTITVQVVIPEKETEEYVIKTDADYLRQALDQEKLIEGKDSDFGFYITGVNKITADESKQEWWCITKRGEEVFYGVDEIAIQDGDQYEITLTTGY